MRALSAESPRSRRGVAALLCCDSERTGSVSAALSGVAAEAPLCCAVTLSGPVLSQLRTTSGLLSP